MPGLRSGFDEKAFEHIAKLASLGTRAAGTEGEGRAVEYVRSQLERMGIQAEREPFEYETFAFTDVDLWIGGQRIAPTLIAFDPYGEALKFAGQATMYDPSSCEEAGGPPSIQDAVVVTTAAADYFGLVFQRPKLILYVDPGDYMALQAQSDNSFSLSIQGDLVRHKSANVIGRITPAAGASAKIILSAHLDAYRDSPGADDNASGVGVLLELARHFKVLEDQMSCTLDLIAFGAEELAILGSRVYVENHRQELERCALVFNVDQVGGDSKPAIEMLGGVQGLPAQKGQGQFPARYRNRALDGQENGWRVIISPDLMAPMMASNHPAWLTEVVSATVQELGIEITPCGNMGSDQQAFAQAGVVATGIGIGSNEVHCAKDTPDQIHRGSLGQAGEIVARVTTKTMQKLTEA